MPNVLIAEPDPLICELLEIWLTDSPVKAAVQCTYTGTHGREFLERLDFDLLITEDLLPEVRGLDLAEQAIRKNVPVLFMSGHPNSLSYLELFEFPHLRKPFGLEQLCSEASFILRDTANNIARTRLALAKAKSNVEMLAAEIRKSRELMNEALILLNKARNFT